MGFSGFDRLVEETIASWHCPGVAIAVVRGNEIVYQHATGLANLATRQPVTQSTRFALASITKSVTAMSAALLVDDRKLDWDRPVCEDLPEFVLDDPYATRHLTLRDMLSHRTGLPRHDYAAWRLDLSRAAFVRRMRHLKSAASFRERFQYNNLMYVAAAHLVEKVAGRRWEELVGERIFAPMGMSASNFEPAMAGAENSLADGYRVDRDGQGRFSSHVPMAFGRHTELSPGPAGALFSTTADMARWLQVHINEGKFADLQLVSRANLREMHAPQVALPVNEMSYALSGMTMQSYGLGWFVRPYPYGAATLVFHDGNVEGHSAHIGFVREAKVGVVVLANAASSMVPTILAREALDRAQQLEPRGWNARFHSVYDPFHAAAGKARAGTVADRPPKAAPTHPLADYAGHYSADGYPDFAVRVVDGALQGCTVGSMPWSELRHVQFDVFEWYVPAWDSRHTALFALTERGEVGAVSIPLSGDRFDITFKRKPLTVDAAILEALSGDYDASIPGLCFEARGVDGKLYWTELGTPAVEILPRSATAEEIEFSLGHCRLVFRKDDGGWNRVQLKTPSAVFEATRKPQNSGH